MRRQHLEEGVCCSDSLVAPTSVDVIQARCAGLCRDCSPDQEPVYQICRVCGPMTWKKVGVLAHSFRFGLFCIDLSWQAHGKPGWDGCCKHCYWKLHPEGMNAPFPISVCTVC